MLRRPARIALLSPLVLAGLAACGGDPRLDGMSETDRMEMACQTTRCLCVEDRLVPFGAAEKREPDWRLTGEPHCPPGFHLEQAPK